MVQLLDCWVLINMVWDGWFEYDQEIGEIVLFKGLDCGIDFLVFG